MTFILLFSVLFSIFLFRCLHDEIKVLLAPTPSTMRAMLAICDNYADDLHIGFKAKNSKCIHIGSTLKQPYSLPELYIGNVAIEFVDQWPHLRHLISAMRDDKVDIMNKIIPYVSRSIMFCVFCQS